MELHRKSYRGLFSFCSNTFQGIICGVNRSLQAARTGNVPAIQKRGSRERAQGARWGVCKPKAVGLRMYSLNNISSLRQAISPSLTSELLHYFCQIIINPPTLSRPFGDIFRRPVRGHLCVEGGVIQRPLVFPAGSLHKRGQVRLRHVQAREPEHPGLALGNLQARETLCGACFSHHTSH